MSMYVLFGEQANLLGSNGGSGSPSPSPATDFPMANAHTGGPETVFRFGSLTAAPTVTYDLDLLLGLGNMESMPASGPLPTWTNASTVDGSLARSITAHSGTYAAEFTAGTGTAAMYKDFTVSAGQRLRIEGWLKGDTSPAASMLVRVQNLQTGNYWTGSVWGSSALPALSEATGTYTLVSSEFTVESYSVCRSDTVQLRVTLVCAVAGGVTYADDVTFFPGVTFASVHGHNIDPVSGLTLRSSTDNFGSSDDLRVTFTVSQPSFYATIAEVFARYWRWAFTGTNSTRSGAIYVGEWVLGQYLQPARGPAYPMSLGHSVPQVTVPRRVGAPAVYRLSQSNQRVFPISFQAENMTQRLEILQIFERSNGRPIVVVPHNADGFTEVVYGRLSSGLPHSWSTKNYVSLETEVVEMAFPLVTA